MEVMNLFKKKPTVGRGGVENKLREGKVGPKNPNAASNVGMWPSKKRRKKRALTEGGRKKKTHRLGQKKKVKKKKNGGNNTPKELGNGGKAKQWKKPQKTKKGRATPPY